MQIIKIIFAFLVGLALNAADFDDYLEQLNMRPFDLAASGDEKALKDCLKSMVCPPGELVDLHGRTLLYHACKNNHKTIVQFLLKNSADPDFRKSDFLTCKKNHDGLNPIHIAIKNNNADIVKMLIDAGAKAAGNSSLGSPIEIAIYKNSQREILSLLLDKIPDSDFNQSETHYGEILWKILRNKNLDQAKLLISYGTNLCSYYRNRGQILVTLKTKFPQLIAIIKDAKKNFNEAMDLSRIPIPLRRIIIGYFGTNSYLDDNVDWGKSEN